MTKNRKKSFKKYKAFSLIELSIVILISGLIVASVIVGRKLVTLANLSKARALTNSSSVNGIENLELWLETASKNSFLTQPSDGDEVLSWKDINPQRTNKRDATGVTTTVPLYVASAVNGLPALRFDGTNDFYNFDGTFLAGSDYTIYAVVQRRVASALYFLGYNAANNNGTNGILIGYPVVFSGTSIDFSQLTSSGGVSVIVPTPQYSSSVPSIVVVMQDSVAGKTGYVYNSSSATNANTTQMVTYNGAQIGTTVNQFFNGDIAEIIVFGRALSSFERQVF